MPPPVDLMVMTPNCHPPQPPPGATSPARLLLGEFCSSLEYVRARLPQVVAVEWHDPLAVASMTGLLHRLSGYTMESVSLDPRTVAGVPMALTRKFWMLERVSA